MNSSLQVHSLVSLHAECALQELQPSRFRLASRVWVLAVRTDCHWRGAEQQQQRHRFWQPCDRKMQWRHPVTMPIHPQQVRASMI